MRRARSRGIRGGAHHLQLASRNAENRNHSMIEAALRMEMRVENIRAHAFQTREAHRPCHLRRIYSPGGIYHDIEGMLRRHYRPVAATHLRGRPVSSRIVVKCPKPRANVDENASLALGSINPNRRYSRFEIAQVATSAELEA